MNYLSCSQAVKQDPRIYNWNKSCYWSCLCRYLNSEQNCKQAFGVNFCLMYKREFN